MEYPNISRKKISFNDYDFMIVVSHEDVRGLNGLVIPEYHFNDIDKPEFITAFRLASDAYKLFPRFVELLHDLDINKAYAHPSKIVNYSRVELNDLRNNALELSHLAKALNMYTDLAERVLLHINLCIGGLIKPESEKYEYISSGIKFDPGYVYLLKSEKGYKIGKSIRPEKRIGELGVKLPFHIEKEVIIKTERMSSLEKELHDKYKDKRIRGEWFILTHEDVEYIKSLA